jgi:hypothetical protein
MSKVIPFPIYSSPTLQVHTCSMCGAVGHWNDRWEWFGSLEDEEQCMIRIKVCSPHCKSDYLAGKPLKVKS